MFERGYEPIYISSNLKYELKIHKSYSAFKYCDGLSQQSCYYFLKKDINDVKVVESVKEGVLSQIGKIREYHCMIYLKNGSEIKLISDTQAKALNAYNFLKNNYVFTTDERYFLDGKQIKEVDYTIYDDLEDKDQTFGMSLLIFIVALFVVIISLSALWLYILKKA